MNCRGLNRRLTAVFIAFSMIFSVSACGKSIGNKVRAEHVYSAAELEIQLAEDESVESVYCYNGLVYLIVRFFHQSVDEEGNPLYNDSGNPVNEYGFNLYTMKPGGTDMTLIRHFSNAKAADIGEEAGAYSSSEVRSVMVSQDGTFWVYSEGAYHEYDNYDLLNETTRGLVHLDANGKEITSYHTSLLGYLGDVQRVYMGPNEYAVLIFPGKITGMDLEGRFLFEITTNGNFGNTAVTEDGDIVVSYTMYEDHVPFQKFARINFDTKSLDELTDPDIDARYLTNGTGSSVFIYNSAGVYSYDANAQTAAETLNWINSDINVYRIKKVVSLPDGNFLMWAYTSDFEKDQFTMLKAASAPDIPEKTPITLASAHPGIELMDAIIDYNMKSPDYRIELKDYSILNNIENQDRGEEQLEADLNAGIVADIIHPEGLPYYAYASKGLLQDLGKLMDADKSFKREDYLENILSATEVNGKRFSVIPFFGINTVFAKSEIVGTEPGWTIEKLDALSGSYSYEDFVLQTRDKVINYFNIMAMDHFFDPAAGTCNFDSQAFIKLLEFFRKIPEDVNDKRYYYSPDFLTIGRLIKADQILSITDCVGMYDTFKRHEELFGAAVTPIGFPCPDGVGATIAPVAEVAISSTTEHTEACWQFIKSMLSEQFQSSVRYYFPVRLDSLADLAETAMTQPSDTRFITGRGDSIDYRGMIGYRNSASIGFGYFSALTSGYNTDRITQEEADKVTALIETLTAVQRPNKEILAIINEEAATYFSSQASAEDAANAIQSRALAFLDEIGT